MNELTRMSGFFQCFLFRYVHKSYYDALGLTPKASQVDIKKAYYKMSMVYHPDKEAVGLNKNILCPLLYQMTVEF